MKIMKTLGFASVVLFLVVSVMYIILFIPLNNQKVLIDIKKIRNRNNGLISKEGKIVSCLAFPVHCFVHDPFYPFQTHLLGN